MFAIFRHPYCGLNKENFCPVRLSSPFGQEITLFFFVFSLILCTRSHPHVFLLKLPTSLNALCVLQTQNYSMTGPQGTAVIKKFKHSGVYSSKLWKKKKNLRRLVWGHIGDNTYISPILLRQRQRLKFISQCLSSLAPTIFIHLFQAYLLSINLCCWRLLKIYAD
jgi:hypothetical protein